MLLHTFKTFLGPPVLYGLLPVLSRGGKRHSVPQILQLTARIGVCPPHLVTLIANQRLDTISGDCAPPQ